MTQPSKTKPGLSVFFPAYNDSGTIASLVIAAIQAARKLTNDFEVIVINDGSLDGTASIADELARNYPEVKVVHHPRNRGYGGALRSGFEAATRDLVFYTDGDAQYDAKEAALLVSAVTPTTDMVQGYKIGRGDSWYRKVLGRVYHHVVKIAFRLRVRDTDCDFRLFRRALLEASPLRSQTGVICVELVRRFEASGARIVEVPVHHYFRPHGRSQFFRLPHILRSARQLAALWVALILRRDHGPAPHGVTRP